MRSTSSPAQLSSVRPPPAPPLEGAALLLVPLALLSLSHPVPWVVFNVCLVGAYLPEAMQRPRHALVLLTLLTCAVGCVRALRS